MAGTLAGFLGAFVIALTSAILLPFCDEGGAIMTAAYQPGWKTGRHWRWQEKALWVLAITIWGGLGSVLDSALGGWLQASVIDTRTGKVIEGTGGKKVSSVIITQGLQGGRLSNHRYLSAAHGRQRTRKATNQADALRAVLAFLITILSIYSWPFL